jgi:uncharacterized membrane protein
LTGDIYLLSIFLMMWRHIFWIFPQTGPRQQPGASKQQPTNNQTMTAKFTILLALLCGLLSLCSVLAGTSAEGTSNISSLSLDAIPLCIVILIDSLIPLPVEIISGLAYLAAKGKEEGVVTLPSGLLYKEIRPGNGEFFSS